MRYWEIMEATKPEHDAERVSQERAELRRKLENARHKRNRAAQEYADRARTADDDEQAAREKLAEVDAEQPDPDVERRRWQLYWAKQQRLNRILQADAEKRSRGLSTTASLCRSEPADYKPTGW